MFFTWDFMLMIREYRLKALEKFSPSICGLLVLVTLTELKTKQSIESKSLIFPRTVTEIY
jgi:hypothetical protein